MPTPHKTNFSTKLNSKCSSVKCNSWAADKVVTVGLRHGKMKPGRRVLSEQEKYDTGVMHMQSVPVVRNAWGIIQARRLISLYAGVARRTYTVPEGYLSIAVKRSLKTDPAMKVRSVVISSSRISESLLSALSGSDALTSSKSFSQPSSASCAALKVLSLSRTANLLLFR